MSEPEQPKEEKKDTAPVPEKKKGHGCLKGCLIVFVLFILVILGAGYFGWQYAVKHWLTAPLPTVTTLTVESGTVQKQKSSRWETVTTGQILHDGDVVKTLAQSDATIEFPNGSQTRLDENTQLTVATSSPDQISLFQSLGRTWSRVEKLAGVGRYEVETPTALATVRGTAFSTDVSDAGTDFDTAENTVEVASVEREGGQRKIVQKISVEAGNGIGILKKDLKELKSGTKKLEKRLIRDEVKNSEWFKRNRQRDTEQQNRLKNRQINPFRMLSTFSKIRPEDIAKLQSLAQKAQSGRLNFTPDQQTRLEAIGQRLQSRTEIDEASAADIAQSLSVIDPENFSDTAHWKDVIMSIAPFAQQMR